MKEKETGADKGNEAMGEMGWGGMGGGARKEERNQYFSFLVGQRISKMSVFH